MSHFFSFQVNGEDVSQLAHQDAISVFHKAQEPIVITVLRRGAESGGTGDIKKPRLPKQESQSSPQLVSPTSHYQQVVPRRQQSASFQCPSQSPTQQQATQPQQSSTQQEPQSPSLPLTPHKPSEVGSIIPHETPNTAAQISEELSNIGQPEQESTHSGEVNGGTVGEDDAVTEGTQTEVSLCVSSPVLVINNCLLL